MFEINEERIYPLANKNGNIQGTIRANKSLIDGNSRVEIRIVGQIKEDNESAVAKQIEHFIKSFFL